jgi:uncharacterized membrane protein
MEVEMDEEMIRSAAPQPESACRLVIVPFDEELGAGRALAQVLAARREKKVAVPAVAEVRRDAAGAVAINEPGDIGAKEGAVAGGLVGGLLGGLFGRRMLAGAALGAALGALGADKHDAGIPNPRLREIGAGLPAGSSALVAIVFEEAVAGLRALLAVEEARMTVEPIALSFDVARQLSAGQYGAAADSLATQAESLIAEAKARLTEATSAVTKKTQGSAGGGEGAKPAEAKDAAADRAGALPADPAGGSSAEGTNAPEVVA